MLYHELSKEDQTLIWLAFDKRFPSNTEKQRLFQYARIRWNIAEDEDSWEEIFAIVTQTPSKFNRLLKAAVQLCPEDSNLQEITEILHTKEQIPLESVVMGLALACLFIMSLPWLEKAPSIVEILQQENILFQEEPSIMLDPIDETLAAIMEPDQILTGSHAKHSDRQDPNASPLASNVKRCELQGDGSLIGYWYVGANPPVVKNGQTHIGHGRNVRIDYPDVHNNYNDRADIVCVLYGKSNIPVQTQAIHVPGNKYWMALYSQPNN